MNSTAATGFRLVFGLVLLAWVGMGLSGWEPPAVDPGAEPLRDAIFGSGYLIPAVLVVYCLSGISFIANRFVALGSVVLFPVSLNILLFHTIMNPNPRSVLIAVTLFLANVLMLYQHRPVFAGLLKARRG